MAAGGKAALHAGKPRTQPPTHTRHMHTHDCQGMMTSAWRLDGAMKVSKAGFTNMVYCPITPCAHKRWP